MARNYVKPLFVDPDNRTQRYTELGDEHSLELNSIRILSTQPNTVSQPEDGGISLPADIDFNGTGKIINALSGTDPTDSSSIGDVVNILRSGFLIKLAKTIFESEDLTSYVYTNPENGDERWDLNPTNDTDITSFTIKGYTLQDADIVVVDDGMASVSNGLFRFIADTQLLERVDHSAPIRGEYEDYTQGNAPVVIAFITQGQRRNHIFSIYSVNGLDIVFGTSVITVEDVVISTESVLNITSDSDFLTVNNNNRTFTFDLVNLNTNEVIIGQSNGDFAKVNTDTLGDILIDSTGVNLKDSVISNNHIQSNANISISKIEDVQDSLGVSPFTGTIDSAIAASSYTSIPFSGTVNKWDILIYNPGDSSYSVFDSDTHNISTFYSLLVVSLETITDTSFTGNLNVSIKGNDYLYLTSEFSSFNVGDKLYVGSNGLPTSTRPSTTGEFVIEYGKITSTGRIRISLDYLYKV